MYCHQASSEVVSPSPWGRGHGHWGFLSHLETAWKQCHVVHSTQQRFTLYTHTERETEMGEGGGRERESMAPK